MDDPCQSLPAAPENRDNREGSVIFFTLKHVLGYPNVRLYEGSWKEYVWLDGKSLPAETGGTAAGK